MGAVDGKHITIQCPLRGGSIHYNYKKFHSIEIMAVADASYKFTIVNIGDYRRLSGGSVFGSCNLGFAITTDILLLPEPRLGGRQTLSYVFVGDDAFPLAINLIKPYSRESLHLQERIANYRISRGCRIVENEFGIST